MPNTLTLEQVLELAPGLRASAGEYVGHCPRCESAGVVDQDDRFSLKERNGRVLAHCRACAAQGASIYQWLVATAAARNGTTTNGHRPTSTPARKKTSRKRPTSAARTSTTQADMSRWERSVPVPGTPADSYLAGRDVHGTPAIENIRWLPGRPGKLLYGFSTIGGEISSFAKESLDALGHRVPLKKKGEIVSPRTYRHEGEKRGLVFVAQAGSPGGAIAICEGEIDSLVQRTRYPGAWVVATGGTSGLSAAADWLTGPHSTVHLELDGDEGGRAAGRRAYHELAARGFDVHAYDRPDGRDPADCPEGTEFVPEPIEEQPAAHPLLDELNLNYCVLRDKGIFNVKAAQFVTPSAFSTTWRNKRVRVGGTDDEPKYRGAGVWWLDHPGRRDVDKMEFAPGQVLPGNTVNLWTGWNPAPIPGDCQPFVRHVDEVIACRDPRLAQYVLAWASDIVQNPMTKPGVVLALRGPKGAGKSAFAQALQRMLGEYCITISSFDRLVARFNNYLSRSLLVVSEEAVFSPDKRQEGPLKHVVTGETQLIEQKQGPTDSVRSCTRLLLCSNSDWVVPASGLERRYAVLDVSGSRVGDKNYFRELYRWMDADGPAHLLSFLLENPISVDVRDIPRTAALREQRVLSLSPEQTWWFTKLKEGVIRDGQWHEYVPCAELFADYIEHAKELHLPRICSKQRISMMLHSYGVASEMRWHQSKRFFDYRLPPTVEAARAAWELSEGDGWGW